MSNILFKLILFRLLFLYATLALSLRIIITSVFALIIKYEQIEKKRKLWAVCWF